MSDSPSYMDITEYAAHLGVPRTWVRDRVSARAIQCTRVGRHVRFTEADRTANELAWREPAISVAPSSVAYLPDRRRQQRRRSA